MLLEKKKNIECVATFLNGRQWIVDANFCFMLRTHTVLSLHYEVWSDASFVM